jgi:hypothetical protein
MTSPFVATGDEVRRKRARRESIHNGTFFPTSIELEYRGDVGDVLTSPQAMGITVPAGDTIDVVVYAIDVAPAGVGSYTLSCSTV